MSINVLTASPLAKGLFQRGIAQSGALFNDRAYVRIASLSEAEEEGMKFAKSQNASSIADLRKLPAKYLVSSIQKVIAGKEQPFYPIVDGYVLPHSIQEIYAEGKQNDVPMLIGSNADEGTALVMGFLKADKLLAQTKSVYGDKADAFLKLYPVSSDDEARTSQISSYTDQVMGWQMYTWARMQSRTGNSNTYLYYFDHIPPGSKFGSFHSAEVGYAYSNLKMSKLKWEDADNKISAVMSAYWIKFAMTGNPNGDSLPEWSSYNSSRGNLMQLGDNIGIIPFPRKEEYDFFDGLASH